MINARSELGSSRIPPPAAASAASSCRNSGLPPLRSYNAVSSFGSAHWSASSCAASSSVASWPSGCKFKRHDSGALRCAAASSTSLPGRIAVIKREWMAAERRDEMLEQPDQRRVGPVQIVDRQHDRALVGTQLEHLRDGAVDRGAGSRSLELVDRRRVPEDVHEDVDHPLDLGLVDSRQQLRRHACERPRAMLVDGQRRVEIEVSAQRVGDGKPHVGLAVRHAGPFENRGVDRAVQVVDQLVGESRLADAVLAGDGQQDAAIRRC